MITPQDKEWLNEKFELIQFKIDTYLLRLSDVEKKTNDNQKFIWILTGIGVLAGVLFGILEWNVN